MTEIRVIVPLAIKIGNDFRSLTTDDVADIDDAEAKRLIDAGFAAPVHAQKAKPAPKPESTRKKASRPPSAKSKDPSLLLSGCFPRLGRASSPSYPAPTGDLSK